MTRDLYNFNLLAKLMVLLYDIILFNLATVEAILMWISAEQVPSSHRVVPTYLKLVSSSNFRLFVLTSALVWFLLFVISFLC